MRGIVPPDARRAVGQDRNNRIPDAAEIAAINATHFADTALKAADLLFVFGTWQDIDLRAAEAYELAFISGQLCDVACWPEGEDRDGAWHVCN